MGKDLAALDIDGTDLRPSGLGGLLERQVIDSSIGSTAARRQTGFEGPELLARA
jgi:hypothetical protein